MLNFTRFAAFSILALCFSRFSLGSDWEYHQFADEKYMMSFPTTPKTIMQKTPDGIDFPVLMCNRNSAALGVSWKPISKYREQTPTSRSLAKDMLNSLKSNFKKYDLLYVNPITYAGWVGADLGASVVAKDAETRLYYRQRFISTETHLIQIIYIDSTRMPLEPWVGDIFYNSLTTVDE